MILHESNNLYCWAWDRVYVKSNGRIPCWCDSGESHTIINRNIEHHDFISDIVNSEQMIEMRLKIIKDNEKYIDQCSTCCCLITQNKPRNIRYKDTEIATEAIDLSNAAYSELERTSKLRSWPLGSIDRITEIQIEPSFPCNLKCPACLHGKQERPLETESKPHILPLEWFTRIIDSVVFHNVKLHRISFVGRGEPTLNKSLPLMIEYARSNIPKVMMCMDTNSTHKFKEEYLLMNLINCSIDGSTKESYDTYRRGGNFESAICFMSQAVEAKRRLSRKCKIVWKYILFNTTEHIELLNKAQTIANNIGIDELNFVITSFGAYDNSVLPPQNMNTLSNVTNYLNSNRIFKNAVVSNS